MKNQLQIQAGVYRDFSLVLDAVRRLKEGTWQLCDEDADWAYHLLPIIDQALCEHIEYEANCLFPGLSKKLVKEHILEHKRIRALLWALTESRQSNDADHFHALLGMLLDMLDHHHSKFGFYPATLSDCTDQCVKNKIMNRAEGSSLEYK